ncbi:Nif3-like dinuclear metal center hexameric protein [Treponema sp.]|uniref:Nif3-like dinuclear metal center hexameric protein n=1 Tax=Treponema sp. TaxID=166 RepID=UPI0025FA7C57|nr:Nif3-like dinuclear metal center hexameric protein [Treponema sp.]MCR5218454.1 Nif3-like dinuclear metal center hexameric protein [Treponema sp.]
MTLNELDNYFRSFLHPENFTSDPSRNGIQIQNQKPDETPVTKIAFAVDACEATALKAHEEGAQLLFVHHGLFWGGCEVLNGNFYKRVNAFMKNDLALYACHIPLDANNPYGNNYGLAARIGLKNPEPFGFWRGMPIGCKGQLEKPLTVEELAEKALNPGEKPLHILSFGKKLIKSVGVISGGAGEDVEQAVAEKLDAYITGEVGHEQFYYVKECGINLIAGGHYQTETVGVNLIKEKVEKELGLETVFIDIPTGL